MIDTRLSQALRLNRSIGGALLFFGALLLLTQWLEPVKLPHLWSELRFSLIIGLSVLFLAANELTMKTLKKHSRLDELMQEKIAILIPLISCGVVSVSYVLTGQFGILVFLMVVALQAQLCSHRAVARMVFSLMGLLYLAGLPFQAPYLLGVPHPLAMGWPENLRISLSGLPFLLALAHYGEIVAITGKSASTRVSKLQSLAATDGLTGLINRREFNHRLDAEIARAKRYRKHLSLALFDIDDFKKINDLYGHPIGDRILKELGQLIKDNVREADIAARYGGEEFALVLPETGQIDAYELLERLRALIERTVYCLPDTPMTATISVGVAQLDPDHARAYELIEKADAALYEAKRQGKNQVVYGVTPAPKLSYPPFKPQDTPSEIR